MTAVKQASPERWDAPVGAGQARSGKRRLGVPFRRLWWAAGISSSGDGLVLVAMPLLAVTLTRSPLLIAGVTAANRVSAALSSLPGGVLADRVDRRRLMVVCNVLAGLVLAGLVAAMSFGALDLAMVYVVSAVLASCDVTYELGAQAYVPALVGGDQLPRANARLQIVTGSGEQFVGPGVGGALFSLARRVPFAADAVSFFASALLVRSSRPKATASALSTPASPAVGEPVPSRSSVAGVGQPAASRSSVAADFREGWRWFKRERSVQLVAAVVATLAFCQYMVFGILVVYGTRTLHLSSTGYGLFYAFASLLGVLAGFGADQVTRHLGAGRAVLIGFGAVVVSYLGLGFTRAAVLAVFVFGLQDVGTVIGNVGTITTRQRLIPSQLYGRVVGIHRLTVAGAAPLGALLGGLITAATGTSTTIVMAGGLELVFLALFGPALLRSLAARGPASAPGAPAPPR
ncbi:MAG: MFS transporter [Acidimicrobiales bacterium]